MGLPRCPICNRFGSKALGDYCKTCHSKLYDDGDEKHAFADFTGTHDEGGFFSDEFGVIKDKFGYEER